MLVVGLTGGISSGKSTVAALFAQQGVPIIDADVIAKALTQTHQPAFTHIVAHFGQSILQANGMLDRGRLRQIIFDHPKERAWLEALLHPLIRQEIEKQITVYQNAPYCLVVVPLLLEVTPYPFIHRILVVDAKRETQIKRLCARDHINTTQAEAMLNTQLDRETRIQRADDLIHNDDAPEALIAQVEKLHAQYTELSRHSH